MSAMIHYGKQNVTFYRTYATPLSGVTPVPESAFVGRENTLFAVDVGVEVLGNNFLPAYTDGDNTQVVATDTMKNFILQQALAFEGATLEECLAFLGRQFLATYPQMHALRVTGTEQPFVAVPVPQDAGMGFTASPVLFQRTYNDCAVAELSLERADAGVVLGDHRCGRVGLHLIKITGSSFADFARDTYTTLPEKQDRPLFIHLDVFWRYANAEAMVSADTATYVPAEQIRDVVQVVFYTFVSKSIQHLVHEMGTRVLARFPQLAEVSFLAQNRLWDTADVAEADERVKVYCDPRPPYGQIGLTLTREEG